MDLESPASPARRGPAPTKHVDILWAAVRLFGIRGFAQTTTREIAAEAGTTERTLFKHFGSKDGLLNAVMREAVVPHLAPTSLDGLRLAIEAHQDDLQSWHRALLEARTKVVAAQPELTRLLLVELLRDRDLRDRFGQEWLKAAWQPLHGLFQRMQREGKLRRDIGTSALVRMFMTLTAGDLLVRYVVVPELSWDDAAEIAAVAALFARGAAPA